MSKLSTRPFQPVGSFVYKKDAVAKAKELTDGSENQKWQATGKTGSDNNYAIVRVDIS